MWTRLFLTSLCLLSVLASRSLPAQSVAGVDLQLEQYPDTNCDGIAEKTERAIPGSCIIYAITALNTSQVIYQDVLISAHIPQYTKLVQTYSYSGNSTPDQSLESNVVTDQGRERLLQTKLEALSPGQSNKVTVQYLVKIL